MTIGGWITFGVLAFTIAAIVVCAALMIDKTYATIISIIIGIILIVLLLFGMIWYFKNTADGQRAMVDQQSNFNNGLERTITVYTATGDIIAQYHGQIDIEGNDGGYVIFDFEGKRYMYYNCFVESIAEIGGNSENN